MTDSEAFLVEEPIPLGPRGDYVPRYSGYMSFERVFECVWGGRRHAMIGPTQIDRWGQTNLSCVGDYQNPGRRSSACAACRATASTTSTRFRAQP